MKQTRWYRREIIERFLNQTELDSFQEKYNRAKLVNIGKKLLETTGMEVNK